MSQITVKGAEQFLEGCAINAHLGALWDIQEAYLGRIDPLTSEKHTDHWAENLYGYARADIARGEVGSAKDMVDYWLDRTTPEGRVPHMIIDTSAWRRRHIDRRVQRAEPHFDDDLKEDNLISPFMGQPVLSTCALMVAQALPKDEQKVYARQVLDELVQIKRYQYFERDLFNDGLPLQIHPDEMLLRAGNVARFTLGMIPDSPLIKAESSFGSNKLVNYTARRFRELQADDSPNNPQSSYDSLAFMNLPTAARSYSLHRRARENGYSARRLMLDPDYRQSGAGFIVQDVALSGMMVADNKALQELSSIAGEDLPLEVSG